MTSSNINSHEDGALLILLHFVLTFSLASTNQCVSPPGSRVDFSLHSLKSASGHWIITVDTRRSTVKENPRELILNVHQETRLCDSNEIEQLVPVAFEYPSLEGTSKPGAMEPNATSTTTTTTAPSTKITVAPSTTSTTAPTTRITAAPSTTTTASTTATSTTRSKSCPHSGYQLFPDFNCYKAFPSRWKYWSDAREQCRRDGGDLMVMETERERKEVFIPLLNSVMSGCAPWVGVYIPQGGDGWMTVKGEPALSTWWAPGNPVKNAAKSCTTASSQGVLRNFDCAFRYPFICEISL